MVIVSCNVDIDECAIGTDTCNSTVSQCENTNGSFNCTCRSGFSMSTEQVCVCEFQRYLLKQSQYLMNV